MAKKRKSKQVKILLIIGGVLAVGYFWVKHQIQFLQFGNASVPFQQIKSGVLNLGITLPIINASSIGISMSRFIGYIKSPEGAILGTVALEQKVDVPKGSEGEARFLAHIRLTDLVGEVVSIITSGNFNYKGYVVEGQAWVYGVPVPIKTSIA